MKKLVIKMNAKDYIAIVVLLLVLIFIIGYFINLNLPYWKFRIEHREVKGVIKSVEKVGENEYQINYSFFLELNREERTRSARTSLQFSKGDTITVMYNDSFPNYVEIKEIDVSPNLFRTLLPIVLPFICLVIIVLGILGKIDLDKFS